MHIKLSFWLSVFHGKFRIMCVLLISGPNGEEFAWYQCTVSILCFLYLCIRFKLKHHIYYLFSRPKENRIQLYVCVCVLGAQEKFHIF